MDLFLIRKFFFSYGIFSELIDENKNLIAWTLEHAYPFGALGLWRPKIPNGVFLCVRGEHQLKGMPLPFETFEITGVNGHSNLLFHAGNFNQDSEGCILVGEAMVGKMITESRKTFETLMTLENGFDQFNLSVT